MKQPNYRSVWAIGFVALFVTALVTAQLLGSKLLAASLPLIGAVAIPGGTLAYAFTFFSTDCMSELYGRRYTTKVVNIAFLMNFVMFALVYATVAWPAAQGSIDPGMFGTVLLSSGNIVMGSLAAYIISQNWDVFAFHKIRGWTGEDRLYLRNLGSTAGSQFIDTLMFTVVAFWAAPQIFGVGNALPGSILLTIIIGQYVAKLIIAVIDTPFVYFATGIVKRKRELDHVGASA